MRQNITQAKLDQLLFLFFRARNSVYKHDKKDGEEYEEKRKEFFERCLWVDALPEKPQKYDFLLDELKKMIKALQDNSHNKEAAYQKVVGYLQNVSQAMIEGQYFE